MKKNKLLDRKPKNVCCWREGRGRKCNIPATPSQIPNPRIPLPSALLAGGLVSRPPPPPLDSPTRGARSWRPLFVPPPSPVNPPPSLPSLSLLFNLRVWVIMQLVTRFLGSPTQLLLRLEEPVVLLDVRCARKLVGEDSVIPSLCCGCHRRSSIGLGSAQLS